MHDADLGAFDLADAALAAELEDRLDEQEEAEHPGWQCERPPPLVLVGSEPPGLVWPSATNAPAWPFGQNPRSSRINSAEIVKAS